MKCQAPPAPGVARCRREATHIATVEPHAAGPEQALDLFVCGKCAPGMRKNYKAEIRRRVTP